MLRNYLSRDNSVTDVDVVMGGMGLHGPYHTVPYRTTLGTSPPLPLAARHRCTERSPPRGERGRSAHWAQPGRIPRGEMNFSREKFIVVRMSADS